MSAMEPAQRKTKCQQVLDLLANSPQAMRRSEIQAITGIQKQSVNIHLRKLSADGLAHISGWEMGRGRWAPLWDAGGGENAPQPSAEEDAVQTVMCEATAIRTALRRSRIKIPDLGHRTTFVGGINPWTGESSGAPVLPAECAEISRIQANNQREWSRFAEQRSSIPAWPPTAS